VLWGPPREEADVAAVHIDDTVIVDGEIDVVKMQPVARLGYMDCAVVDELFTMPRPADPAVRLSSPLY
jgi:hypothetical protein